MAQQNKNQLPEVGAIPRNPNVPISRRASQHFRHLSMQVQSDEKMKIVIFKAKMKLLILLYMYKDCIHQK